MVYFTCNACGEQLKKPSVEKHYTQKCRKCTMLTCIDCLKDFYGDEYKTHMSCMSEEQRYSKEGRSGWDPEKGQGNKGEKRQNIWTANLRAILAETENIDSDVRNIVNTILDHENIPRKKAKFVNFVKNIMRNRANVHSIDKTWDLFSQALKPTAEEASQKKVEEKKEEVSEEVSEDNVEEEKKKSKKEKKKKDKKKDASEENGDIDMSEDDGTKKKSKKERKKEKLMEEENAAEETSEKENTEKISKKKKKKMDKVKEIPEDENKNKKRKREEAMEVDEDETSPKKSKFDWDDVITGVLMKKDGNEMKLNKLKKKCVSEFFSQNEGTHKTAEEVGSKFDKKLKKRKYRLLKDKVKLILEEADLSESNEDVPAKPSPSTIVEEPKPELSFNKWEASNLGSSAQTDKFRRLMGIKSAAPPQAVQGMFGGKARDDQKIFKDLEQGFEKARQAHFGGRCFEQ
eukprot:GFUD01034948.1.p1 GENE.GFUD01034948.1~~GFUD01034948.1.p1  ORF type:complete len:482 (+),score=205.87 GFUD01034948.1:70-1446(+)